MKASTRQSSRKPPAGAGEAGPQGSWSGTISFGLVAIPVRLVSAVEPGRVAFRLLHRKEYSPLLRRMYCPEEAKIVPDDEIVRGYEIAPDKYVLVSDEELESVSPGLSRTIEIQGFTNTADVDPIYYDHPYYLLPTEGGEKSYRLLAELMRRAGRAGIAKVVLHERQYIVALVSDNGVLSLITLHYGRDIVPDIGLAPRESRTSPKDLLRMNAIIREMSATFSPDKYADARRRRLLDLLKRKAKGKAVVRPPEAEGEGGKGPVDLVAVLEASMRKGKRAR